MTGTILNVAEAENGAFLGMEDLNRDSECTLQPCNPPSTCGSLVVSANGRPERPSAKVIQLAKWTCHGGLAHFQDFYSGFSPGFGPIFRLSP